MKIKGQDYKLYGKVEVEYGRKIQIEEHAPISTHNECYLGYILLQHTNNSIVISNLKPILKNKDKRENEVRITIPLEDIIKITKVYTSKEIKSGKL